VSNTLNFLKCNLQYCPKQCKEVSYFALVRSMVEYGSVVWDPHISKDNNKVERVNRRAARMVSNDYGRHSSVTSMLTRLGWVTLDRRREKQRLTMMYRVVHGLVAVPTTHLTAADSHTRTNHSFKFRSISCNSMAYALQVFLSSANHSFLEPPTSRNRQSYVRRCIQASSSVVRLSSPSA